MKKILWLICLAISLGLTDWARGEETQIHVKPNWNLLSSPYSFQVSDKFGNPQKFVSIWKWINDGSQAKWAVYLLGQTDGGKSYASSKGFGLLQGIEPGEGFWVKSLAETNISLSGTPSTDGNLTLKSGWNLVGLKSQSTVSVSDQFGDPSKFISVWKWDTSKDEAKWAVYLPGKDTAGYAESKGFNVLSTLEPKEGFWVNVVPQKVEGVAAGGMPIVGYVYLKDSAGHIVGPNTIASDGSFSFDVVGLTAPFYLKAQGSVGDKSCELYSVATGAGTANINPLTNLAVAAAGGVNNPASVYNNQIPISQENLDNAVKDIQNMLKPLLDTYNANINPITGKYTFDHTGLDAVFDVVDVNIESDGSVTLVNKVTDMTIAKATTSTLSTTTDPLTQDEVPSTQIVTDLKEIQNMINQYVNVTKKGPSLTFEGLEPFFAINYGIDDGLDRTQAINGELSEWQELWKIVTSVNFTVDKIPGSTDYKVYLVIYYSDGSFELELDEGIIVTKEGGAWKFKGNGFKSDIDFDPRTHRWIKSDDTIQTESGFGIYIEDPGNYGLHYAKVKGPGLPETGITLQKCQYDSPGFCLDPQFQNYTIPTHSSCFYVMDDTTIASIPDNSTYTFYLYDSNSNLVETRTKKILKRPFLRSEVTEGHFPSFGGISSHSLSAANIGSTLSFSYQKPTVFLTGSMDAYFDFWDYNGHHAGYGKELLFDKDSETITSQTPSWQPMKAHFEIEADDEFDRNVSINWMFE